MPPLKANRLTINRRRPSPAKWLALGVSLTPFGLFVASSVAQSPPPLFAEAIDGAEIVAPSPPPALAVPPPALDVPPYSRDVRPYVGCPDCQTPIVPGPGAYAIPVGPRGCDLPDCAIPAPPGTYVRSWQAAMTEAACREAFVVRRHEWFAGGVELGPEGRRHIARIAMALAERPEFVLIDGTKPEVQRGEGIETALARAAGIDAQRRQEVVGRLLDLGIADAEARVVVAAVETVGIRGIEAPIVYGRMIQGGVGGNRGGGSIGVGAGGGLGGGLGGGGLGGGAGF